MSKPCVIIAMILALSAFLISGCASVSQSEVDKNSYEHVSVDALFEQISSDESQARFDCEGKAIVIQGLLASIHPDECYFTLRSDTDGALSAYRVVCRAKTDSVIEAIDNFSTSEKDLAQQSITAYGRVISIDASGCIMDVDEVEV